MKSKHSFGHISSILWLFWRTMQSSAPVLKSRMGVNLWGESLPCFLFLLKPLSPPSPERPSLGRRDSTPHATGVGALPGRSASHCAPGLLLPSTRLILPNLLCKPMLGLTLLILFLFLLSKIPAAVTLCWRGGKEG